MTAPLLLTLLIALLLANALLDLTARWLNLRHQPPTPPAEIAGWVDTTGYATAARYRTERTRLGTIRDLTTLAATIAAATTGAFAVAMEWANTLTHAQPLQATLVFFAIVAIAADALDTPFASRATFGIEARYGFNKTTPALFLRDKLVAALLTAVFGSLLIALLLWTITTFGRDFWLPYAAAIAVVTVLLATFQTSVLLPLFNRLTPLPEGPLRDAVARYAQAQGVALSGIFVMDGSKRSTRANAFFSGLGRQKKVVLFDTLIERHPADEVIAVLAHEIGHAKHRDVPKLLVANLTGVTLLLFVASAIITSPLPSLALGATEPSPALAILFVGLLFTPLQTIIGVAQNALSRRQEFAADAFAANTTSSSAMANTLRRFVQRDYATATAHPLYTALHLTHPAPVERIRALERLGSV
jgi:STE24 endopeptidase